MESSTFIGLFLLLFHLRSLLMSLHSHWRYFCRMRIRMRIIHSVLMIVGYRVRSHWRIRSRKGGRRWIKPSKLRLVVTCKLGLVITWKLGLTITCKLGWIVSYELLIVVSIKRNFYLIHRTVTHHRWRHTILSLS